MKWIAVKTRRPKDGQVVWAYFGKGNKRVQQVMYTPGYIAHLCEEDEGQWKGMGSTDEDNWTHWMPIQPVKKPKPPC